VDSKQSRCLSNLAANPSMSKAAWPTQGSPGSPALSLSKSLIRLVDRFSNVVVSRANATLRLSQLPLAVHYSVIVAFGGVCSFIADCSIMPPPPPSRKDDDGWEDGWNCEDPSRGVSCKLDSFALRLAREKKTEKYFATPFLARASARVRVCARTRTCSRDTVRLRAQNGCRTVAP